MPISNIERDGNKAMFYVHGNLTSANVSDMKEILKNEIKDGLNHLIFDFANTQIIDSSGIGILVATYNSVSKIGGRVEIVNASADIKKLLQHMRLSERLGVM
ncbi:MAG: STAS domain-containing protein [Candidatus Delongbacteria bacterium]|nr:STAS domain-containing protein [Candidatus Delongbacteria bacterium]MBN2833544.1 STAS domain-containing protein [Candidatus Delongbacteria bacterium]